MGTPFDESFKKDFYSPIDLRTDKKKALGRFYWTHTYYPHEHLEFWRPSATDTTSTSATDFRITAAGEDRFNHLTLANPKLESNEEFVVVRAKRRPVLMLVPPVEIDEKRSYRGSPVSRKLALVAQIYSVSSARTGEMKFDPAFIANIRELKYPQILFLPQKSGVIEVDSLLRLDECQSVFTNQLEAIPFEFSKPIKEVLQSQFLYLFNETDDDVFSTFRDMCAEA
jgi:hypothetical protein